MPKQTQAQAQVQKVIVNIGERKKPRKKRAKRKPRVEEEPVSYLRLQQPSVVYTSGQPPSTDLAQAYKLIMDKMMALQISKNTANVIGERQMESQVGPVSAIATQTPPLYPDMAIAETQTAPMATTTEASMQTVNLPTDEEVMTMKKAELVVLAKKLKIGRVSKLSREKLLKAVLSELEYARLSA